ncbi:MAG: hypothetical protein IPO00_02815 [Betaproteobacteria bacterium]|nr:hypothetical protein [Betaproteobacteria bacterium]
MSAIGAGIGASSIGQGVAGSVAAATSSPLLGQVAAGMVGSVVTQGLGIAVGAQKSFSWAGVAAAGVGSGVGHGVGLLTKGIDSSLVRGTLSGLANSAARAAVSGGRVNWGSVAADAFGNALGNYLVDSIGREAQQVVKLNDAENTAWTPERQAALDNWLANNAGQGISDSDYPMTTQAERYANEYGGEAINTGGSAGKISIGNGTSTSDRYIDDQGRRVYRSYGADSEAKAS